MPSSPAEKAGVHQGDVITQIDGQKIEGAADVVDYVAAQKVGAKLTVALFRDGKASKSQVTWRSCRPTRTQLVTRRSRRRR
jgi:S1-C subfamily serine protease